MVMRAALGSSSASTSKLPILDSVGLSLYSRGCADVLRLQIPLLRRLLSRSSVEPQDKLDSLLRTAISTRQRASMPSLKGKEKEQPRDLISVILDALAKQRGCSDSLNNFGFDYGDDEEDWTEADVITCIKKILQESYGEDLRRNARTSGLIRSHTLSTSRSRC